MSGTPEWRSVRLKALFVSIRNGIWGDDPDGETDTYCVRGTDFDRINARISRDKMPRRSFTFAALADHQLKTGDLVLEKSGGSADQPVGSVALFDLKIRAVCSNFNARLQVADSEDPRFVCYLMNSLYSSGFTRQFVKQTTGIQNLDAEAFLGRRCALPPPDEQRRIADFLDIETARIDALIADRAAQISMLGELELARIGSHLSGDSYADHRHTGWPWLPSIPIAWDVGPVYAYFNVQLGKMLNAERASGDSQQPYLRNANIHWYGISTSDVATMAFQPEERIRYGIEIGDLLVCEGGAGVAEAAIWHGGISPCFYQKSLHRVRATSHVPPEWLMYWLRFAKASGVFEAEGNIATIPHLTGEQLAECRIPIPVDGEDRVTELSSEIAAIHSAQRAIELAQSVLSERRRALITAAVTGQMDVTTARSVAAYEGAIG